jgi:hypothetical protein
MDWILSAAILAIILGDPKHCSLFGHYLHIYGVSMKYKPKLVSKSKTFVLKGSFGPNATKIGMKTMVLS